MNILYIYFVAVVTWGLKYMLSVNPYIIWFKEHRKLFSHVLVYTTPNGIVFLNQVGKK